MISKKIAVALALLYTNSALADWIVFKNCTEQHEHLATNLQAVVYKDNSDIPKLRMYDTYLSSNDGWTSKWLTIDEVLEVHNPNGWNNLKGWTYTVDLITGRIYDGRVYQFCEMTTVEKQKNLIEKFKNLFN